MNSGNVNHIGKVALSMLTGCLCLAAHAQTGVIQHGTSSASVDLSGGAGMFEWNVGGLDRLVKQWFYYRAGDAGLNQGVQALQVASWGVTGGNILDVTYGVGTPIQIGIRYELLSAGPSEADIKENIWVRNMTSTAISGFRFFQFSDFNLNGNSVDEVQIIGDGGVYYAASQWSTTHYLSETVALPEPGQARADNADVLLAAILNQAGVDLDEIGNGPQHYYSGDAAWAFQWTYELGGNQQVDIVKDKWISVIPIPEPGMLSLVMLGCIGLFLRRKSW